MRSGEDGRAERRPVHFAQDQSRLRREKPIDRQYRRATIAPLQRNTKVTVTEAMMVYGLKAKPLYRSPQMIGGAASIRTPSRAYANCLSACRRLSRAVHFRTFGRRLLHGALKRAVCASWLIVSSSDYHEKQQRQGLPSAAGSVSSCRPARKVRPMGIIDKTFEIFAFPAPASFGLNSNSPGRTPFDARIRLKPVRYAATCCAEPAFSLICAQGLALRFIQRALIKRGEEG